MEILQLVKKLKNAGVRLQVVGDNLKVQATKGVISPELIQEVRKHKAGLLSILSAESPKDTIPKASKQQDYPLSVAQEGIWALSQDMAGSQAYHMPIVLRLHRKIHSHILEEALQHMVERHEILRTSFPELASGEPRQKIEDINIHLSVENLGALRQDRLKEIIQKESMRPFHLDKAPLFRGTLLQLDRQESVLLITFHHLITDGLSIDIFKKELLLTYQFLQHREKPKLPELHYQYTDFAVWQKKCERSRSYENALAYWKDKLSGDLPVIDLKPEVKRPPLKTYQGSKIQWTLSTNLWRSLKSWAQGQGITPFPVLLAALNSLIYRYTGNKDILLGTVVGGRENEAWQQLIGLFLNTLPLRSHIEEEDNFEALTRRQNTILQEALSHQEVPFARIVEALPYKPNPSRSALFDIMVIYNEYEPSEEDYSQTLQYEVLKDDLRTTAQFDLTFSFHAHERLDLTIEFATDIYDKKFIKQFGEHLHTFLEKGIRQPATKLTEIVYLPDHEIKQLLYDFNSTYRPYNLNQSLVTLIRETVTKSSEKTALISEQRQLTYREFWQEAEILSTYLRQQHGIGHGKTVAVQVSRTEMLPVSLFAVWHSGAAYLPLDLAYPEERTRYILEDSDCDLLVTDEWLQHFRENRHKVSRLLPPETRVDDLAYVIYTSGSTGKPKGVMLSHKNVSAFVQWALEEFESSSFEILYASTSHCFDLSIFEFFYTLASGKTIRMLPSGLHIQDAIAKDKKVLINTVPSVVQHLLKEPDFPWEHVSTLNMAGEPVPTQFKELLDYKHIEVRNLYGPSETTTYSTCYRFSEQENNIPIGKPIANTRIYILDEQKALVPAGVNGEIFIAGSGLTTGYCNQPGLTAQRYLPDPFYPGEKMYMTGDIGRWDTSGLLHYVGRKDHQIKLRGFRIELGEIEQVLERHKQVEKAIVMLKQSRKKGPQLIAWIKASPKPEINEFKQFIWKFLPSYMTPGVFQFIDTFPLTPNGKTDRAALTWKEDQTETPSALEECIPPRNDLEKKIHQLWQEVLGQQVAIGITHNFFEQGGNSLHAARLASLLKRHMGFQQGIRFVFKYNTIAEQAAFLAKAVTSQEEVIPRVPKQTHYRLSAFQERIYVLCKEGGEAYHIPGGLELKGPLDKEALQGSFRYLIDKHELFRSVFEKNKYGEPVRRTLDSESTHFKLSELTMNSSAEITHYLHQIATQPFDLANDLPLRFTLVSVSEKHHYLLYCLHHIVADGWSLHIMVRDLMDTYTQLLQGKNPDHTPLPFQFQDFLAWHEQQTLEEAEQYWKQQLAAPLPVLDIPIDHRRPQEKTFHGDSKHLSIPSKVVTALNSLCLLHNTTLFTALLTSIRTLLYRYTHQQDSILGTVMGGREHPDMENQIGPYLNTLPLRNRLTEELSFEEQLKAEHQVILDAMSHQGFPLAKMLDFPWVEYDPARSPLFDIMVVYQNQEQLGLSGNLNHFTSASGLEIATLEDHENRTSQMDMSFIFTDQPEGLSLSLVYNTDIYPENFIKRMLANYEVLIESILQNPQVPIRHLNMLNGQEIRQQLIDFNAVETEFPKTSLVALFEKQVVKSADRIAISDHQRTLRYSELNAEINQLAHFLQSHHIKPNHKVCIQMKRSADMVIAALAVIKCGAAYVPIAIDYPEDRKKLILQDCDCQMVLDDATYAQFRKSQTHYNITNPTPVSTPASTAYIIYTSGSTGTPKGVAVAHRNVVPLIKNTNFVNIQPEDTLLQWSSFAFDGAVWDLFGTLLNGAHLVMITEEEVASVERLKAKIETHQVSLLFITTALFNVIVDTDLSTFKSLRKLLFGGELVSVDHVQRALDYLGSGIMHHMYGPTETTVYTTAHAIDSLPSDGLTIPIGGPLSNTTAYILDTNQQLLPQGAIGEICIGGDGLSLGYLNDLAKTRDKFVPHPFIPGEKLYRSGDLGRWQEQGGIAFIGRIDHQVKIRGHRIELAEIEFYLSQVPEIEKQIVDVKIDAMGDKFLCAFLVSPQNPPTEESLRKHLHQFLPDYMIPDCFIVLNALPLTSNGKVDRKQLPLPKRTPAQNLVAPATETEEQVLQLWKDLLGDKPISVTRRFAELGGHSLKATRLAAEIRKKLNVEIPLVQLLYSNIREQAKLIETTEKSSHIEIPSYPAQEHYPLSLEQTGIVLADILQKKGKEYSINGGIRLRGKLDHALFKKAFLELFEQHHALKTVFRTNEAGEIMQFPLKNIDPSEAYTYANVSDRKDMHERLTETATNEFLKQPLDLEKGPLFRLVLIQIAEEEYVMIYFLHHAIADGWSLQVLREHLLQNYVNLKNGSMDKPERPIQYTDYALWQKEQIAQGLYQVHKTYWENQFKMEPQFVKISDKTENPLGASGSGWVTVETDEALYKKLRAKALAMQTSMFSLVYGAINLLIYSYTGQTDITLPSPFAGRAHASLSKVIGCFADHVLLRAHLQANNTLHETLAQINRMISQAYHYQAYPVALLHHYLQETHQTDLSQLNNIAVNFHNLDVTDQEKDTYLLEQTGLRVEDYQAGAFYAKYDLNLVFREEANQLIIRAEYKRELYSRQFVEEMTERLKDILRHILQTPQITLRTLKANYQPKELQGIIQQATQAMDDTF
ncbi:amino acid adenylation domain-containing protein [Rapidithrix thailandica]|uniref:Amino acid adenylation domain-containing protein n=1 Tax=Rapidithrix thailandica TaxID=413964 RepID=A0AAW9SE51_9BACT